jgi:hypothetical protein
MAKNKIEIIDHFNGKLAPHTVRRVTNKRMVHEMRNIMKLSPSQGWRIKMEVPVDMATDCDQSVSWINARLMELVGKGFLCFELEGFLSEVKFTKDQQKPDLIPFWFATVLHPQGKDPREALAKCVHYDHRE